MPKQKTSKKSRYSRTKTAPAKRNEHAAGIDIGAEVHYVAVDVSCDPEPVRHFGTFTEDLHALADWLIRCGVRTVAMESTGVYWIPLFQILESRGLEVCLVNARHVKNVPGRKTDVQDCQWLQYLHSVGLLMPSFRPTGEICAVRSLLRHRDTLMRGACEQVQRMQKSLDQMNILLHHVVSDITGTTGLAILDAIIAGERNPLVLATLRDKRCKKSQEQIAKALVGDWRREHLFTLQQSLQLWRHHQQSITECETEINALIATLDNQSDEPIPPAPKTGTSAVPEPQRAELFFKLGVDLTAVEGVGLKTAQMFLTEVGPDVSRFSSAAHFASWLGLCPDNRISGGRKLGGAHTRQVSSRLANVLRMAVQNYHRSESALGDWFRRLRSKLGTKAAVTAAAHKLARVLYAMVKTRTSYNPQLAANDTFAKQLKEQNLRRQAKQLGYELSAISGQVS